MDIVTNASNRKKVCHVTTVDISVRFLLLQQLKYLSKEGYVVSAVCSKGEWVEHIKESGIPVHTIDMKRGLSLFADIVSFIELVRYFKKERFDIVHTHTPKAGLIAPLAARIAGVPMVIHTVHGFLFHNEMNHIRKHVFILFEKLTALFTNYLLSQSKEDVENAIIYKICDRKKIMFIGNGINVKTFDKSSIGNTIKSKKCELGIKNDEIVIGMVGRLVFEKGFKELYQAALILFKKYKNIRFLIIGSESPQKNERESIQKMLTKLQPLGAVNYLGMRLDMPQLYSLMDIFILPSYREGIPRALMEASAMEIPVIASNVRGCREVVDDHQTGLLFSIKDPNALACAIQYLIENPTQSKEMGTKGRKRVLEYFDEEIVFNRIKDIYYKIVNEKVNKFSEGTIVNKKRTRLAVVYHIPFYYDGVNYSTNGAFGRYIESLSRYFNEIVLCVPVKHIGPNEAHDYFIQASNISFCELPYYDTLFEFILKYPRAFWAVLKNYFSWDIINIRMPTYLSPLFYMLLLIFPRPCFLLIVGDTKNVYRAMGFKGVKHFLSKVWVVIFEYFDKLLVKRAVVFTNGEDLFKKYSSIGTPVYKTITSTISQNDVIRERLFWNSGRINLLYVGRFYPEKGLLFLIEAIKQMKQQGENVFLTLVGGGKYKSLLVNAACEMGIEDSIVFSDYLPLGSKLFDIYKSNSVFVLPSLSEGVPRVLLEAMASGLPVIATDVGGVSSVVRDNYNGLLIAPKSSKAIVDAIQKITRDALFRENIIENGLRFAAQHTIEKQAREIIDTLSVFYPKYIVGYLGNSVKLKQLKVLHLVKTSEGGGWLLSQVLELKKMQFDITVVCPRKNGWLVDRLRENNVKVNIIPIDANKIVDAPRLFWGFICLTCFIAREKFDVVHYHLFLTTIMGRIASFIARVPIKISMCTGPLQLEERMSRFVDKITSFIDDKIIVSCEATRKHYIEMGVPESRLELVYYGMDLNKFNPMLSDDAIRKEFGILKDAPIVGIVAYFYPPRRIGKFKGKGIKGHEYFLHAAAKVKKQLPQTRFLIVGDEWQGNGLYKKKLIALSKELGLENEVVFTGVRRDIPNILASFDVSVQCSLTENVGGAAESLLMERPTITTNVGGFPDVIKDHETGLLVPPADSQKLAEAIIYLIQHREKALELGKNGRVFVAKLFDIKNAAKSIADCYNELARKKGVL